LTRDELVGVGQCLLQELSKYLDAPDVEAINEEMDAIDRLMDDAAHGVPLDSGELERFRGLAGLVFVTQLGGVDQ
jgi:hypothetical protein